MRSFLVVLIFATACAGRREGPPSDRVPQSPSPTPRANVETTPSPAPEERAPPAAYQSAKGKERGVFDDLQDKVELRAPSWVDRSAGVVVRNKHGDGFLFVAGVPIAFVGDTPADIDSPDMAGVDQDGDGFPDQLDLMIGAKKAAANNAPYGSPYREIDYPGGDVPRGEGVCTDVVVRAVRNAGVDLQQTLHEDIKSSPRGFPMVKKPNANIDHRRVKTLLPHFERQWQQLPVDEDIDPWLPGDIIFMQTMGDERPDHLGIVSDELGLSGAPLIINNWTDGFATSAMDIARLVPITQRFRMRSSLEVPAEHAGLPGLLRRQKLEIPDDSSQALVVTGLGWNSVAATLTRFERVSGQWTMVGQPVRVTLGASGLGAGRGIHTAVPKALVPKKEGDQRAPAGVFDLGTAFGRAKQPFKGAWPYRRLDSADRFVDDPESRHYNTWQVSDGDDDWSSAERMEQYVLGLVVKHNMPATPRAGSAIFLHTWQGAASATLGCTAMAKDDLEQVLAWLRPDARPVLVQVAGHLFEEKQ